MSNRAIFQIVFITEMEQKVKQNNKEKDIFFHFSLILFNTSSKERTKTGWKCDYWENICCHICSNSFFASFFSELTH